MHSLSFFDIARLPKSLNNDCVVQNQPSPEAELRKEIDQKLLALVKKKSPVLTGTQSETEREKTRPRSRSSSPTPSPCAVDQQPQQEEEEDLDEEKKRKEKKKERKRKSCDDGSKKEKKEKRRSHKHKSSHQRKKKNSQSEKEEGEFFLACQKSHSESSRLYTLNRDTFHLLRLYLHSLLFLTPPGDQLRSMMLSCEYALQHFCGLFLHDADRQQQAEEHLSASQRQDLFTYRDQVTQMTSRQLRDSSRGLLINSMLTSEHFESVEFSCLVCQSLIHSSEHPFRYHTLQQLLNFILTSVCCDCQTSSEKEDSFFPVILASTQKTLFSFSPHPFTTTTCQGQ